MMKEKLSLKKKKSVPRPFLYYDISPNIGPIATFFIRRIGCRWTVMIGGLTSMIGLALSSLAPSLTMLLFYTYGGIPGNEKI